LSGFNNELFLLICETREADDYTVLILLINTIYSRSQSQLVGQDMCAAQQ